MIRYVIALLVLLTQGGYGQTFKKVGVSAGINFTSLKWEYRNAAADDIEIRRSKDHPVGFNVSLTADLIAKKNWSFNSCLGWIQKKGLFTEMPGTVVSVPYNLNAVSLTSLATAKVQAGKHFSLNAGLGPRLEYLLTRWDELPAFAPNDDTFFYYHKKDDVRKFVPGLSGAVGLNWHVKKTTIQLSGWRNLYFNPIISAHGLRPDRIGDEGFYFKMKDATLGINLQVMFSL